MSADKAWSEGVVYACAELIRIWDQPTMAQQIFLNSGADAKLAYEQDVAVLRQHGITTDRGLP